MKDIRVLAIDGGGIRGIIPAQILYHVEQLLKAKYKKEVKIGEYFDLIVGTSTGGILTCLYLTPDKDGNIKYSSKDAVNLYLENADKIFYTNIFRKIFTLCGLLAPKYTNKGIIGVSEKYFGHTSLNDLIKPCIITSYNIEKRDITLFKQHKADNDKNNFLVKDIVCACSAAPTYFKPYLIKSFDYTEHALIDGGVYAINPALCGYIEAKKLFENCNIRMLSIGTGNYKKPFLYKKFKNYGMIKWLLPILEILNHSSSTVNDYYLKRMFNLNESNYLRINGNVPISNKKMDDCSKENMKILKQIGDDFFDKFKYRLMKFLD